MNPSDLPGDDPIAAIEAWREEGGARVDPVGFAVIEALARRAAAQQGETRRRLVVRFEALLANQRALKRPAHAASTSTESEARRAALAGLSDLVDRLRGVPNFRVPAGSAPRMSATRQNDGTRAASPFAVPVPASRRSAVTAFKGTWSRLRAEQRLRQALAQVPATAGPLNSSHVMNRALQAMRDLSPEYLDAFMLHIDTLLSLEQVSGGVLPLRTPSPAEGGRGPGARGQRKL
jgi:hypothetical protein